MISLEWLGVAGFRIRSGSTSFLIDPYVTRHPRACPPQSMRPEELRGDHPIFITHGHFDHVADVAQIAGDTAAIVYGSATALAPVLRAGLPLRQLHATSPAESIACAGFQATAYGSRHTVFDLPLVGRMLRRIGWDLLQVLNLALRYPAGQVLSWRFDVAGQVIHHLGTGGSRRGELVELSGSRPDVLLVPLQGHSRIHEIAVRYVDYMRPRIVIPHHQDDFYPPISEQVPVEPFVRLMRERHPDVEVIVPAMHQPIAL